MPFLGEIPIDTRIRGGDSGGPIVVGEPKSEVAEAYMRIAEAVAKSVQA